MSVAWSLCGEAAPRRLSVTWSLYGKAPAGLFAATAGSEREKTLVVSCDSEPDHMKMRIYTTNVISRAIYTPKIVFACI